MLFKKLKSLEAKLKIWLHKKAIFKPKINFAQNSKSKILIFGPDAGVGSHFNALCVVGKILEHYNHDVWFAKCTGVFERCPVMGSKALPFALPKSGKDKVCEYCQKQFQSNQSEYKFKYFYLDNFLTNKLKRSVSGIIKKNGVHNVIFEGINFSNLCSFETSVALKKILLFKNDKKANYAMHRLVQSAIQSYCLVKKILQSHKFNTILYYNDYAIQLGAGLAAKRLKVNRRLISHASHKNVDRRKIVIYRNSTAYEHYKICSKWKKWKNLSLNQKQVIEVGEDIIFRFKGIGSHIYSKPKTFNFQKEKNYNPSLKTIVVFTSSPDEISSARKSLETLGIKTPKFEFLFGTNFHDIHTCWIKELSNYFKHRNDIKVIVRIHPREGKTHRESNRSLHLTLLKKNLTKIHKSIQIVWPEEAISSYDLAEQAHLVLTSWSTIGLEMARLGVPVLSCTKGISGAVDDFFHQSVLNKKEYFKRIESLLISKSKFSSLRYSYRWWNLFSLGGAVGIEDLIPSPSCTKLPKFHLPRNASTIENAITGQQGIFELNRIKLLNNQTDKSFYEETKAIIQQTKKIIAYLLTGDEKSCFEITFDKKTSKIYLSLEVNSVKEEIFCENEVIKFKTNKGEYFKKSPMISRLVSILIKEQSRFSTI